jgi:hypothetical protein
MRGNCFVQLLHACEVRILCVTPWINCEVVSNWNYGVPLATSHRPKMSSG